MSTTITFTATFLSAPVGSQTHTVDVITQDNHGSNTYAILDELAEAFFTTYREKMQAKLSFTNNSVTLLETTNDNFRAIFDEHSKEYSARMESENPDYLPATIKLIIRPE